jgi:hypothetical protein
MATIALAAAGAAVGGSIGGGILGISSVAIGQAVGASVGRYVDTMIFSKDTVTKTEGARLSGSQYMTSNEGAPIPVVIGRGRIGGEMIWGSDFIETIVTDTTTEGGKGGPRQINETTAYIYTTSFAIGLCEAVENMSIARAWADGKPLDLYGLTYRFYDGTQTTPDDKIESVEGSGNVPAFTGTAYIVFEDMELTDYGNRIPQITVELVAPIDSSGLETKIEAINVIPATGEFALGTTSVQQDDGEGNTSALNNNFSDNVTDFVASLNSLEVELPNVTSISLIVAWFGDDLDAGTCEVKPKVDASDKDTEPYSWTVSGVTRATADTTSLYLGNPAYGGTPSDRSVREAFQRLKDRGFRVSFYPFLLMDMTDYPWRGRIESASSGDTTSFLGSAAVSDFTLDVANDTVTYSGSVEWTHRRMILHYATLISDIIESGDVFIVGTEMRGMSESANGWGSGLATLISDVKSILPTGVEVGYAADWSEYKESELSAAFTAADFIGIDYYLPLTDWRDEDDVDYTLQTFIDGASSGEYWDYFYADEAARLANTRTTINSAADRQKDIRYWRDNNYSGKKVIFTEAGCAAIDKGANQPNVFFDPKSSESQLPWFSDGTRNDLVQNLYNQAVIDYYTTDGLVDADDIFIWTWDARPYPSFPGLSDVWSDGGNYMRGHWLNGRMGSASLDATIRWFTDKVDFPSARLDTTELATIPNRVRGLYVAELTSPRNVIAKLAGTFRFDTREIGDTVQMIAKNGAVGITIDEDDMILSDSKEVYTKTRAKDTDLPDRVQVDFTDELNDYQSGSVDGASITGLSNRVSGFGTPVLIDEDFGFELANSMLQEAWVGRDTIKFSLPLGSPITGSDYYSAALPGAWFDYDDYRYRITRVTYSDQLDIEAAGFNSENHTLHATSTRTPTVQTTVSYGSTLAIFPELPFVTDAQQNGWSPRIATYQSPWPGSVAIYAEDGSGGYVLNTVVGARATIGVTTGSLPAGTPHVWDTSNTLNVRLYNASASLSSKSEITVLNGANRIALETSSGDWEIVQFLNATLEGDGTYTLDTLLRGQLGTEEYMDTPLASGARVIVYDTGALGWLEGSDSNLGIEHDLRYGPAPLGVSDDRYTDETVTPEGVAYRPYSPVHLEQQLDGSDIVFSWVRRDRFGDSWEVTEIPLNEDSEQYEIDVLNGASVVRTITVDGATTVTYTAAQQTADFGSTQSSVDWNIYQISAIYGRGTPGHG